MTSVTIISTFILPVLSNLTAVLVGEELLDSQSPIKLEYLDYYSYLNLLGS
jgi:hypothetical protein